jgi:GNAT superfamily N-acetyltransferase
MIHIRLLEAQDLPVLTRLKEQAGWNQLEPDLHRLLDLEPDGCFLAELDGRPVGTTTTCVFGPVAWVAMVLVEQTLRGRGIGTALMEHALTYLARRGVQTIRLDATPLGQPVYEKLGFVAEYRLARHQGVVPLSQTEGRDGPAADALLEFALPEDLEAVARLDREITHTDRRKLLERLHEERPTDMYLLRIGGRLEGFVTSRPGANAAQIGPCLASATAGPPLLTAACRRHAGQNVFIDIPESHAAATALARGMGLTVQRHLLRMARGVPIRERTDQLWASSGPEKG